MTGASDGTRRVTHVNANWSAAAGFELLVVTEDGARHTTPITAADLAALGAVLRPDVVLLRDPEDGVLVVANIVGEWVPQDWTAGSRP